MIRYINLFSLFVLLISAVSCNSDPNNNMMYEQDVARDAVIAEINAQRDVFMEAVKSRDMETLGSMMTESTIMVMPASEGWMKMKSQAMGPLAYDSLNITPKEIQVINNEWAFEFGSTISYYTPEGESEAVALPDTYLMIFRNQGDGWKLYREVASGSPIPE